MKSIIIKIIMPLLIGALISGVIVSALTGCKSFKPIKIESQPDECNDFYSVLQYYSVQGGDSAFVGTVYEKCANARKDRDKAENRMLKMWGNEMCDKLYKDDVKKYRECIK